MELNRYIDHTLLKPEATTKQIETLCEEAKQYHFASVCVNPCHIALCKKLLAGSDVKVCTVIGFPLGANTSEVKAFETKDAIAKGAEEVDMVINIGALKDKNYDLVRRDIEAVVKAADHTLVKVIFETCLLDEDEIRIVCQLCKDAKADYVKTSTGFNKAGANTEVVALMAKAASPECKVKAAGGVRNYEDAIRMIQSGASRIGTSAGIAIVTGQKK